MAARLACVSSWILRYCSRVLRRSSLLCASFIHFLGRDGYCSFCRFAVCLGSLRLPRFGRELLFGALLEEECSSSEDSGLGRFRPEMRLLETGLLALREGALPRCSRFAGMVG